MSLITYARLRKYMDKKFEGIYSVLRAGGLITTWAGVQHVVRAGLAENFFEVGDQFVAEFDGEPFVWDIIGINHDTPSDPEFKHSLTIQSADCLMNAQFSAPQALYYAKEELPAGEHVFTRDDTGERHKIITTEPIPAGGQIFIPTWGGDPYPPLIARTYAADRTTVIEDNIDIMPTEDADTLGEVNVHRRMMYGSNNYVESAIRQWLNSEDEVFQWEPQTPYDRPSTYSGTGGFLHRLDPELAAVIGPVHKQVARNTMTDGGGQDTFTDKVFLLSRLEVYGGLEGVTTGEKVYPFYEVMADAPTTDGIEGRIKYLGSSSRNWWLRPPYTGTAHHVRAVTTDGRVSNRNAYVSIGAAPACCIW